MPEITRDEVAHLADLARAAERTDTTYVDVWRASAGHDVCADEPWVNGQQGVQGGAIPFHPLPAGQRAVADLVVEAVEGRLRG